MKTPAQELADLITELRQEWSALTVDYRLDEAAKLHRMIEILDQIQKRLDAGNGPVKVLIAVRENAGDDNIAVITSTAPVVVVSVDHRPQASRCLHAEMAPTLAVPTEFIEAVSDEAAFYLSSCKASDQLSVLSKL
jgi:hypothetical protein